MNFRKPRAISISHPCLSSKTAQLFSVLQALSLVFGLMLARLAQRPFLKSVIGRNSSDYSDRLPIV